MRRQRVRGLHSRPSESRAFERISQGSTPTPRVRGAQLSELVMQEEEDEVAEVEDTVPLSSARQNKRSFLEGF